MAAPAAAPATGAAALKAEPSSDLFCFPFAGGSAAHFRELARELAGAFAVWAANVPGHGARWRETAPDDMAALAAALAGALSDREGAGRLAARPFAFFGHSLGARLAFEVARELRRRDGPLPSHLFVSACPAPQLAIRPRAWHELADDALVAELRRYNGLPQALLEEPELLALLLPALRADLRLLETAVYTPEAPFDFPICALGGNQDPLINVQQLDAWRAQTTGAFRRVMFAGDHFFLQNAAAAVAAEITAAASTK